MADLPDYYRVMGVSRLASAEEIKTAFREMARKRHPDFGGTTDEFVALQQAYEVLNDPAARAEYDAALLRQAKAEASGLREKTLFNLAPREAEPEVETAPAPTPTQGKRPVRDDLDSLLRRGQIHEADALARRWLSNETDPGYAHYILGLIKLREGQPDEATARFSMALQHEPRNEEYNRRFEAASKQSAPEPGKARSGCLGAVVVVVALALMSWRVCPPPSAWSTLSAWSARTAR